jgi:hypothetical protein
VAPFLRHDANSFWMRTAPGEFRHLQVFQRSALRWGRPRAFCSGDPPVTNKQHLAVVRTLV